MADYNRDEMRRQELRITSAETKKKPIVKAAHLDIEIDIDDDLFLKVAKAAHERDITINTMINNIIKDKLHDQIINLNITLNLNSWPNISDSF